MKLIEHINFNSDIDTAVLLLKSRGILASNSSENVNIPRSSRAARFIKQGVWIHLNHQYQDAVSLLQDKNHEVTTGLTEEEITHLTDASKSQFNKLVNYLFFAVGVIVVSFCLIYYFSLSSPA